ncbi:Filamentous hemagglutinin [Linum perenne]
MGGDQKLTTMVMKVDLDCTKCRKKIKRVLCGIPQIQNQVYDDKNNLVIITVLCCSPEKVMEKIRCRGGESVKGIEIVKPPPPKPKEPEKPKEKPKEPEKPKVVVVEKPKEKPKEAEKPSPEPEKPKDKPPPSQPKTVSFAEPEKPKQPDPAPKPLPAPAPQPGPPPPQQAAQGIQYCCRECYEGCGVGPCYSMLPAPPCYQAYGRPVYDSWGGGGGGGGYYRGGGYYVTRGECFSDDNPSGCVVM